MQSVSDSEARRRISGVCRGEGLGLVPRLLFLLRQGAKGGAVVNSQADLARALGVSRQAVSQGIKEGRLPKSTARDSLGSFRILDLEAAVKEWHENSSRPNEPEAETLENASATLKKWQAALAELKFREAAKEYVLGSEVFKERAEDYSAIRTRLLAIPSRARQALPHLVAADLAVLENLIGEALTELSEDR
jgi:terminase small subunit / prophage DNA-packing protein